MKRNFFKNILLLGVLAIFAWHISFYWHAVTDEAYITFRYARNLVNGLGYVYNPDERIEGTSSVLWTLWISLGIRWGIDPLLLSKISGIALGSISLIYITSRTNVWIALCIACSGIFSYWCVSGMETPLFTLALLLAIGELRKKDLVTAATIFGILPWIRTDGLYFSLFVFAPIVALYWKEWNLNFRKAILPALLVVIPYVAILAWRHWYFGEFQPNTYDAKFAKPSYQGYWFQMTQLGIPYIKVFWSTHFWLLALWAPSIAVSIWKRQKFLIALNAALILYQLYFVYVGGDWMPQLRWYAAILPLFLMLTTPLFEVLPRYRNRIAALAVAIACSSMLYNSIYGVIGSGLLRQDEKQSLLLKYLGRQMKSLEPNAEQESIFLGDIGAIGYESEMYIIDGGGLVNKQISQVPSIHFWKSDRNYVLSQNPEWVILRVNFNYPTATEKTKEEFLHAIAEQPQSNKFTPELWAKLAESGRWFFEKQLLSTEEFHARYATVMVTPEFDQPQYLAVFCRQDVCESETARRLHEWAPNLGHVKAEFKMADADAYLRRTTEIIPHEESALLEFAKRTQDAKALRSIASNWQVPTANRIDAHTALGLQEYEWKQYHAARNDFEAVVKLGNHTPEAYSNVGWALQAIGKKEEADHWFKKGEKKK